MNIVLLKGKELKSALNEMKQRVRSWTEYVASIGCSVVVHAAEHGDTSLLQTFFDNLPNNYTRPFLMWLHENGATEWLTLRDGKFGLKKTEEAKEARKKFAENPLVEDWTDFKVRRETSFDLNNVKNRLEGILKSAEKHDIRLPEDAMKGITMAIASVEQTLRDMKAYHVS